MKVEYFLLLQFHLLDVEARRVLFEFLLHFEVLHVCLVPFGFLFVSLAVNDRQNRKHGPEYAEKGCIDVLNHLILSVGKRNLGDEHAKACLAPMVVQEAEVALNALQPELLECKNDAKEEEVEIHDCIMRRLQLNHGEAQS